MRTKKRDDSLKVLVIKCMVMLVVGKLLYAFTIGKIWFYLALVPMLSLFLIPISYICFYKNNWKEKLKEDLRMCSSARKKGDRNQRGDEAMKVAVLGTTTSKLGSAETKEERSHEEKDSSHTRVHFVIPGSTKKATRGRSYSNAAQKEGSFVELSCSKCGASDFEKDGLHYRCKYCGNLYRFVY